MSVLLILLMHLVNGAQFLNVTLLFLSSACLAVNNCASVLPSAGPASPVIVIVPLTSIYASVQPHKLDLSIVVLNVISLLVYVSFDSSFISTQFFVLHLDG